MSKRLIELLKEETNLRKKIKGTRGNIRENCKKNTQ